MARQSDINIQRIKNKWLSPNGYEMIRGLRRDGYTIEDVAKKMGISHRTILNWSKEYPELKEALAEGKQLVDYRVENALLKAALGYKTKEVRTTVIMRYGKVVEKQKEVLEKEMAPNVYAIQTYLFNRLPDKWKRNRDQILDIDQDDAHISIQVTRANTGDNREQAEILPEPGTDEINTELEADIRINAAKAENAEEVFEENNFEFDEEKENDEEWDEF